MVTFKAAHSRSYYKSQNSWLNAIYRKNKSIIDEAYKKRHGDIGLEAGPRRAFLNDVKEYVESGMSTRDALKTLSRSTTFTPAKERIQNNFWAGIKGDTEAYKQLREITKEKGRYAKFDRSQLVWDREQKAYIYKNKISISFKNSPYGIEVNVL